MLPVISETNTLYPCTINLLHNGENFNCVYESNETGKDVLLYICQTQKIPFTNFWGLKFINSGGMDEERHWLDLNHLVRSQVKYIDYAKFYFRLKVYPVEPYKISEQSIRYLIFQQLRLDLLGGRLACDINEAGMLVALILQHVHCNFNHNLRWMYINSIKTKILRKERFSRDFFMAVQSRALDIYEKLLNGFNKLEVEDLFLRMASNLDSYGVEPFLVRNNIDKREVFLCMNYLGFRVYHRKSKVLHILWDQIAKINHEGRNLLVYLLPGGVMVFETINYSECNYIYSLAIDNLIYFNTEKFSSISVEGLLNDRQSESSSEYFSSLTKKVKFNENEEEKLLIFSKFLKLLNPKLWTIQVSLIYFLIFLYLLGYTNIFDKLGWIQSAKDGFEIMSNLFFNKILAE